jgi:hypothetical protein
MLGIIAIRPTRPLVKRMQTRVRARLLTPAELFQGKKPDIPFVDPSSIKRAKREDEDARKQGTLI